MQIDVNKLSDNGFKQYIKYRDYYDDKFEEWDYNADMISLIESDAKEHKEYKEES